MPDDLRLRSAENASDRASILAAIRAKLDELEAATSQVNGHADLRANSEIWTILDAINDLNTSLADQVTDTVFDAVAAIDGRLVEMKNLGKEIGTPLTLDRGSRSQAKGYVEGLQYKALESLTGSGDSFALAQFIRGQIGLIEGGTLA